MQALFGGEGGPEMGPETGPKPGKKGKGGGGGQMGSQNQSNLKYRDIAQNFWDFRQKYSSYHYSFGLWEFMNGVCVFFSMCATHWLLNYKFFSYGLEVFSYMESLKSVTPMEGTRKHDPMCELFPTEVSCSIQIGASTGGVDKSNFLCILGNNLFNQKYFLILWVWWVFLLVVAILGLIYRVARILVPDFSRWLLLRKIHGNQLSNANLRSADYFVLQQVLANLPSPKLKDQVLEEIDKLCEQNEELVYPLTNVRYNQSPGNGMFNSVHTPIMKSLPSLYPSLPQTKTNLGHSAPSAPEPEEPSPAYHNSWAHGTISPPSGDKKDAGAGAGSSESGESNSTSTEV